MGLLKRLQIFILGTQIYCKNKMQSKNNEQENSTGRSLGVHPEFEGIVLSHWDTQGKGDLEQWFYQKNVQ